IGKKIFVFLIIHRDLVAAVDILFPELSISPITLPQTFEGTPTEALKTVQKKIQQAEKEREAVLKKAWTYVQFEKDLQITFDFVSSQRERHQNENKIRRTQEACFLNGWVLAAKVPLLEQRLATLGKEWVLSQRDPLPNENIPIQLKNHSWVANFDILTRLFGLPNYTEIDPTPFVAVFFFIFFGMCMGDFIYGLLMALVCFMGTSKIKMPESSKRFIRMFGWVGVSSMIYGALTGSWMGDFFDYLPPAFSFLPAIKKGLTIVDPLKNPILIIILALCIGLVQVLIGLLIGFAKEWKRKNYGPAIMDKLGWFIFIVSIVVFVITIRFAPTGKNAASYLVIACALFLVGTQGRSKKNPIQKVLSGIISLYGVTGYLGDVLSYSRLFALGLTSSIIAMLARTLAQVMGETPYIGWLIGLLVLLIFNVFNLLMSGLGAFVHSARLQYVEFFTKFYEDGGKEFQPFKFKTKYVRLSQGRS
ncbi:MAG: V-type ATPase 116kDa subunit family protein, partial [Atribacterota bacterium]